MLRRHGFSECVDYGFNLASSSKYEEPIFPEVDRLHFAEPVSPSASVGSEDVRAYPLHAAVNRQPSLFDYRVLLPTQVQRRTAEALNLGKAIVKRVHRRRS